MLMTPGGIFGACARWSEVKVATHWTATTGRARRSSFERGQVHKHRIWFEHTAIFGFIVSIPFNISYHSASSGSCTFPFVWLALVVNNSLVNTMHETFLYRVEVA